MGRLKPEVNDTKAAERLTALARRVVTFERADTWMVRLRPAAGDTSLVENLERPLRLLMIVVGLILVIASANVANLLLARSYARQPEIAVRRAIGATRGRIVQQLLTEGFVLALAGGFLGLLLAFWIVALFELRTPGAGAPLALRLEPNLVVVGFSAFLSSLAAIGAGVMPALATSRPDLVTTIKGAGDAAGIVSSKRRIRTALSVVQVALSLVLVVGAGLFLRSLSRLRAIEPTIITDQVIAGTVNLALRGYDEPGGRQFYDDIVTRARRVPGVQSASLAYVLPATAGGMRIDVNGSSTVPKVEGPVGVDMIPVADDFFRTIGVPLMQGRDFTAADREGAPLVVIVNERMKRRFWPSTDAIGQRLTLGDQTFEVVGLARDSKYRSLRESPRMTMYVPLRQSHEPSANLVVRSSLPLGPTTEGLRAAVRELDAAMPLYNIRTLEEHVNRSLYLDRLRAELISWLAALAVALAAIGIYGVMSSTVAERTHEVGIRLAIGAQPAAMLAMVLGAGARLAGGGIIVGLLLTLWMTTLVATQLFGVSRLDAVTLAGASALLFGIVLIATLVPARRATRIDPMAVLHRE